VSCSDVRCVAAYCDAISCVAAALRCEIASICICLVDSVTYISFATVSCRELQLVAVCCDVCVCTLHALRLHRVIFLRCSVLQCVLQYVAVRCSVLQCVAMCCNVTMCVYKFLHARCLYCVHVPHISVLYCVALSCSGL